MPAWNWNFNHDTNLWELWDEDGEVLLDEATSEEYEQFLEEV